MDVIARCFVLSNREVECEAVQHYSLGCAAHPGAIDTELLTKPKSPTEPNGGHLARLGRSLG